MLDLPENRHRHWPLTSDLLQSMLGSPGYTQVKRDCRRDWPAKRPVTLARTRGTRERTRGKQARTRGKLARMPGLQARTLATPERTRDSLARKLDSWESMLHAEMSASSLAKPENTGQVRKTETRGSNPWAKTARIQAK